MKNIFYSFGLHWEGDKFFLSVWESDKRSMGLTGYCQTIESAIEHTDHFIPLHYDKKKCTEEFKKLIKDRPNEKVYYIDVAKVKR